MSTKQVKPTPSNALKQFGEELEALKQSYELSMMVFLLMHDRETKNLKKFAKEHGEGYEDDATGFTVKIGPADYTEFKRLEKNVNNVNSSIRLVPRNFLVALLCTYDAFLGKIVKFIFEIKPAILDSSDRILTYSELLKFENVESAREYLIEKETETILRKSHVDHFQWFESKLKCSFTKGLHSWPRFVEITQRRNLFVHTDGVVSSQYLSICHEHKCEIDKDIKVGDRLTVTEEYFKQAFECLYEIGIKLTQVIWRRLDNSSLQDAGSDLVDVTLGLIENCNYTIAIKVLEFFIGKEIKHHEESTKRIHVINLAQAYKWNGNEDECRKLLNSFVWSGWEDKFKLAVHVLKEEWQPSFSYMRRLAHNNEFDRNSYRNWPLFKQLIKQADFPSVYKECYSEEFSKNVSVKQSDFERSSEDIATSSDTDTETEAETETETSK